LIVLHLMATSCTLCGVKLGTRAKSRLYIGCAIVMLTIIVLIVLYLWAWGDRVDV